MKGQKALAKLLIIPIVSSDPSGQLMTLATFPILYDVVKGGSPQSWISRTSRSVSLQYRPLRCKFGIISLQSEQSASQRHLLRASPIRRRAGDNRFRKNCLFLLFPCWIETYL